MSDAATSAERDAFPRLAILTGCDSIDQMAEERGETISVEGNNDMTRMVVECDFRWLRFHITPSYFEQPRRYNMKNRHLLCNIVTDPDQNPKVLRVIERIVQESGLPVLNPPERIWRTTREGAASLLAGTPGLLVPKVLRLKSPSLRRLRKHMEETDFQFPALVREPGRHNGEFVGLFEKPEELRAIFGTRHKDYVLTEFVDFVSDDGLYRKDRIFFIGDFVMPRHRITSNVWNLHADEKQTLMPEREDLIAEECEMITGGYAGMHPTAQAALAAVRERYGLDYFAIDCNVRPDGQILLFEANATTNFFPLGGSAVSAYLRPILYPQMTDAFTRLVEHLVGQPGAVQAS